MARHDLGYAIRVLVRRPAFAALAILTLALGVGATTAIFSVVHAVMLTQLPYPHADRLVVVGVVSRETPGELEGASLPDYVDWRDSGLFEALGAYDEEDLDVTGRDQPFRVAGAEVSDGYFDLFEARAVAGRLFSAAEYEPGGNNALILSRGLWERRFGADPSAIGTMLRIGGDPHQIVGVVDNALVWPSRAELWVPLAIGDRPPQWMLDRDSTFLNVVARLQPDVPIEQARAQLDVLAKRAAEELTVGGDEYGVEALPLRAVVVGPRVRLALTVLLGAVLFVLISACLNVVNLLLARAIERERELAVRAAMGASRWALLRGSLAESAVLAVTGGGLGLLFGYWGVQMLVGVAPPDLPRLDEVGLNAAVVFLAFVITALVALLFGLVPAARIFSNRLTLAVRESGGSTGEGRGARRVRRGLVIAEVVARPARGRGPPRAELRVADRRRSRHSGREPPDGRDRAAGLALSPEGARERVLRRPATAARTASRRPQRGGDVGAAGGRRRHLHGARGGRGARSASTCRARLQHRMGVRDTRVLSDARHCSAAGPADPADGR